MSVWQRDNGLTDDCWTYRRTDWLAQLTYWWIDILSLLLFTLFDLCGQFIQICFINTRHEKESWTRSFVFQVQSQCFQFYLIPCFISVITLGNWITFLFKKNSLTRLSYFFFSLQQQQNPLKYWHVMSQLRSKFDHFECHFSQYSHVRRVLSWQPGASVF